jgi:hypothetical protein
MPDRSRHLIARAGTPAATAAVALLMLAAALGTASPQGTPPPAPGPSLCWSPGT